MSKKVSRGGSSVKEVKPVVSTGGKVDVAKKSSSRVVTPSVKVSSGVVVESVVTSARSSGKPASVNTGKSGSGSGSVSGSVKKAVESAVTSSVGSGVAVGKSSSASVGVVGSGVTSPVAASSTRVDKGALSPLLDLSSLVLGSGRAGSSKRDWNRDRRSRKRLSKSYEGKTFYLNGCPLNGDRPVMYELDRAFGIGMGLSKWLCMETGVHPLVKVGRVSSSLKKMEKLLEQRKLLVGSELRRIVMKNVSLHMSMGTNRGIRMRSGLPTRGQRTSTNGRTAKRLNGHRGGTK